MLITTEPDRSRIVQAIQAGAATYVTKPFSQEDLGTKIAQRLVLLTSNFLLFCAEVEPIVAASN